MNNSTSLSNLKNQSKLQLLEDNNPLLREDFVYLPHGSFGTYFTFMDDERLVGVKYFNLEKKKLRGFGIKVNEESEKIKKKQKIMKEIKILAKLKNSRYSVNMYYYCVSEDGYRYYIVMEHIPNESLNEYNIKQAKNVVKGISIKEIISSRNKPPEVALKVISKNIALGIKEFKDLGIVHRDISENNIIILPGGNIKFIDFGESCMFTNNDNRNSNNVLYSSTGTRQYLSPEEIYLGSNTPNYHNGYKKYNKENYYKRDVWSYGILMHQLFYGNFSKAFTPNYVTNYTNFSESITNGVFPNTRNLQLYKQHSSEAFEFISSILSKKDPTERPSIEDVLAHPFLVVQLPAVGAGGSSKKFIKLKDGSKRLIRYGQRGGRYYIKNNKKNYI